MKDKLQKILDSARKEITSAQPEAYEDLRVKYLGRKAELSLLLRQLADLSLEEKVELGSFGNQVKTEITELLKQLKRSPAEGKLQNFDPTIPGIIQPLGHLHPVTQTTYELIDIFRGLGYDVATGPEVELEKYNFDMLNIPADHPARDQWDTFWVKQEDGGKDNTLLRTHTSPVQIRYMLEHKPPIRIISPGRTFRYEAEDATHSSVFYQLEGLVVDEGITVANLKATLQTMMQQVIGSEAKIRLRPSFFPFTEPSFEMDVWFQNKWLELMGCGMVNPIVLKNCGINPDKYSGFAFGVGIDRLVMLKYNIKDIRYFLSGNLEFLEQF
ncbi:MAG: phenylalanine--tRNA ligase subunit alpha [Patescibacteria group bacterium]|jgi:phenylalanyl-tRNA synthetase alpha chain